MSDARTKQKVLLPDRTLWPRMMRAETAAAYVDERSVQAFLRGVGPVYPQPKRIAGKGKRWLKDALDEAIDRLFASGGTIRDIADHLS